MIGFVVMPLMAAALAGQAAVGGSAESTTTVPSPTEKRLCRREVPIGSIMLGRRICLTAAQWKRVDDIRESRADGFYHRSTRAIPNGEDSLP